MATKAKHLAAIKAQRIEWSEADSLLADQLADLRAKLDRERKIAANAPATVSTAAGNDKPNPLFAVIEKLSRQEAQLTRRLGLGLKRTKAGQYETTKSPIELRRKLWDKHNENCQTELIPGLWLYAVRDAGVEIDEDQQYTFANPKTLPGPSL